MARRLSLAALAIAVAIAASLALCQGAGALPATCARSCTQHCTPPPSLLSLAIVNTPAVPCCDATDTCKYDVVFADYRCIPAQRICAQEAGEAGEAQEAAAGGGPDTAALQQA